MVFTGSVMEQPGHVVTECRIMFMTFGFILREKENH